MKKSIIALWSLLLFMTPMKGYQMNQYEIATLGGGCFWCIEAVFQRVDGVLNVKPGYAAGHTENPTYKEVCTGETGHAEVARISFDPTQVTYEQILNVFWQAHDPTTINRQGADIGTQYRSIILYHNDSQKKTSEKSLRDTNATGFFENPIVTTIEPLDIFYPAEDYHDNYYELNSTQGYCQFVIKPKLDTLSKKGIIR